MGQPDKINDVAITWPPGQAPWVIAAYDEAPLHQEAKLRERDVAVLAAVGRAVTQAQK